MEKCERFCKDLVFVTTFDFSKPSFLNVNKEFLEFCAHSKAFNNLTDFSNLEPSLATF